MGETIPSHKQSKCADPYIIIAEAFIKWMDEENEKREEKKNEPDNDR